MMRALLTPILKSTLVAAAMLFFLVPLVPAHAQNALTCTSGNCTPGQNGSGNAIDSQGITVSAPASTQTNSCGQTQSSGMLTNPLNACNITQLLGEVMSYVVQIGTVFLTFMLIYVGFQFVSARGNEEKISKARTSLVWTVVGGLLLLGATLLANAIAATVASL